MEPESTRRAYEDLEQRLRPFVSRRVHPSDIDDVLQEIFLKIQCALPSLRDEERFAPWIYAVARSAIADRHRARARQPLLGFEGTSELPDAADTEEPSPLEQELASYMVPRIAELPAAYREALTLTEIEGLSQRAAANALGISLSGMKSRVQRGRERLRELLEACCRIAVDARGRVIDCEPKDPSDCRCRTS